MDEDAAWALLGLAPGTPWSRVRLAYRRAMRANHPDVIGPAGTEAAAELNLAYSVLAEARRTHDVADDPDPAEPSTPTPAPTTAAVGEVVELRGPPAEAFRRVVAALDELGQLTYVDRSGPVAEAVVTLEDGRPASLVVSLRRGRGPNTYRAHCVLEALDRAERLGASGVAAQLADLLPDAGPG